MEHDGLRAAWRVAWVDEPSLKWLAALAPDTA